MERTIEQKKLPTTLTAHGRCDQGEDREFAAHIIENMGRSGAGVKEHSALGIQSRTVGHPSAATSRSERGIWFSTAAASCGRLNADC